MFHKRVKSIILLALALMLLSATASAQPAIRLQSGVVNASSLAADIARGSWFDVFGAGLGPAALAVYSGSLPYPTAFSGTSVTFTPAGGGSAIDTRVWYTLATQVGALLPSSTPAGAYDVRVTYNGQTSAPYRVNVVDRNFGFATQAQNGAGPAQATYGGLDLNRFTTGTLGQYTTRPARPNDTMILWGTGIGADASSDVSGGSSGDQTSAAQVRVIVGGTEVTPAYAGRSGGSPGLDQINFTLPGNVAASCFVSIQVRAGGRLSNLGSIAVASPGASACSAPGLTSAQLSRLDAGGSLAIGSVGVSKDSTRISVPGFGSVDSKTESAFGSFDKYTVSSVGSLSFAVAQIGACSIFKRSGTQNDITASGTGGSLDAGPQLTLNGPNAANKAIAKQTGTKSYSVTLYSSGVAGFGGSGSPTLVQGAYTIAGPGGPDVGAFSTTLNVPGDFVWTNQNSIPDTVPRSSNLNITWTGGGTGWVQIAGFAATQTGGSSQNPVYDATGFVCTAAASANQFSVPSSVLLQLPAVTISSNGSSIGLLSVDAVPDPSQGQFTAPLTAGGNLDQAFFTYSIGASKSVGWN